MQNHVFDPLFETTEAYEKTAGIIAENSNPLSWLADDAPLPGKLLVESNLPPELRHGLFARPTIHDVGIRFATAPAKCSCDSKLSLVLGMSITVLNTDDPQPEPFHLVSLHSDQLDANGHQKNHPMDEEYFSRTPFAYGRSLANIGLIPSSPGLLALKKHPFSPDTPNVLREAIIAFFHSNRAEFDFNVQLHAASKDGAIPHRTVARLIIPSKNSPTVTASAENPVRPFGPVNRPPLAVFTPIRRLLSRAKDNTSNEPTSPDRGSAF